MQSVSATRAFAGFLESVANHTVPWTEATAASTAAAIVDPRGGELCCFAESGGTVASLANLSPIPDTCESVRAD